MDIKTILIVDDCEFDRNLLAKAIARKGNHKTLEAANGDECLKILKATHVDLIILDIMMPNESGISIISKVRQNYNLMDLPIIMVTSKTDASDIVNCLQNGANDYITKPVNFEIAMSRISLHLKFVEMAKEASHVKVMVSIDAMISTYNHEINNPLAIALGYISRPDWTTSENAAKIKEALWRISDIVKKIKLLSEKKEIEYNTFGGDNTMVKL